MKKNMYGKSYLKPRLAGVMEIGIDIEALLGAGIIMMEQTFLDNVPIVALLIDGKKTYYQKVTDQKTIDSLNEDYELPTKGVTVRMTIEDGK